MGMLIQERNVALDVRDKSADTSFVSHAHLDHTGGVNKKKEVLASNVTLELIEARQGITPKRSRISGARLLSAGHILGSRQLYAGTDDGYSFVYSGDYQIMDSMVAERIEIANADVLIIDSTYPYKEVVFEDKNEVVTSIQHYIKAKLDKGIVLFGAYALGKAQELAKIVNEVGVVPVVSGRIGIINEIYRNNGVALDYVTVGEGELATAASSNFVGIVDMHKLNSAAQMLAASTHKRVFTAVATGFARMFNMRTDVQFALSDHADFKQACEYIDQCSPKAIYTYGSRENQRLFAENLSGEGYNAHPFYENLNGSGLDVKATMPTHAWHKV